MVIAPVFASVASPETATDSQLSPSATRRCPDVAVAVPTSVKSPIAPPPPPAGVCQEQVPSPSSRRYLVPPASPVERIAVPSWAWLVGVRASLKRESLPTQKLVAPVPNAPAVRTPLVVVITGRFAVVPIAPALLMLP